MEGVDVGPSGTSIVVVGGVWWGMCCSAKAASRRCGHSGSSDSGGSSYSTIASCISVSHRSRGAESIGKPTCGMRSRGCPYWFS